MKTDNDDSIEHGSIFPIQSNSIHQLMDLIQFDLDVHNLDQFQSNLWTFASESNS